MFHLATNDSLSKPVCEVYREYVEIKYHSPRSFQRVIPEMDSIIRQCDRAECVRCRFRDNRENNCIHRSDDVRFFVIFVHDRNWLIDHGDAMYLSYASFCSSKTNNNISDWWKFTINTFKSINKIQVFIKSINFLLHQKTLKKLKQSLEKLYEENDCMNPECDVMEICGRNSIRLFLGIPLTYSASLAAFAVWPFISYFYLNYNSEPPIPLLFPGVDHTTKSGMIATILLQYSLMTLVIIGVAYYDGIFAVLIYNTLAFSGLIVNHIEQLNVMLADEKQSKLENEISYRFRNIILMYIERNEWVYTNFLSIKLQMNLIICSIDTWQTLIPASRSLICFK